MKHKSKKEITFRQCSKDGRLRIIKAYRGNKRIGHIFFSSQIKNGYCSTLNGYVNEGYRGIGIYKMLIKEAASVAFKIGAKGIKSEGYQRSNSATIVWNKIATHCEPFTPNAILKNKISAKDSDYFYTLREENPIKSPLHSLLPHSPL